jgi:hypothetical protein
VPFKENKNPSIGEKFSKQLNPTSTFIKDNASKSKRSDVLIVHGDFAEDEDHVHVLRHVGSSGCKPSANSVADNVQERGGTIVSLKIVSRAASMG